MKALILAGGLGTRFAEETGARPGNARPGVRNGLEGAVRTRAGVPKRDGRGPT